MKRTLAILGMILLLLSGLTGCGASEQELQSDFEALTEAPDRAEQLQTAAEFLNQNLKRFDEDTAGRMVMAYEDSLLTYIADNGESTLLADLEPYYDKEGGRLNEEKLAEGELASFYQAITKSSLYVVYYENAMQLRVDYQKLLSQYGDRLPDAQRDLYALEDEVLRNPISENATLMVSWDRLLDRALQAESLIRSYPEQEPIKTDALWIYTSQINAILMGTINTPIFNYETTEFSNEAKTAYENFLLANPDTTLSWVLTEYFDYLHSIDFKLNYNDSTMSKVFFDTCDWLVSEAEKRVSE